MVVSSAAIAALVSTGLISLAPNLLLFLFPQIIEKDQSTSVYLSLGQAIAAGGLLGDVFLHTLDEAPANEDTGPWVLLGFTIFLAADLLIRSLSGHSGHGHGQQHQHKASSIVLNLAADALHNFTDGLAIGASYAAQKHVDLDVWSVLRSKGGMASVSILLHEIPHELGDLTTLMRAGFSQSSAIAVQFVTALAAFLGTLLALTVSHAMESERLLWVTAGGFIYLSSTTILPEVLEDGSSLGFRLTQLVAFMSGVALLYAVDFLEHDDHAHGHSHHQDQTHHDHDHGEL